jgi:hypothetical protein
MKQLILFISLFSATATLSAQNNNLKLSTPSFEQTYRQAPLVIEVRKTRKSPSFTLPQVPNLLWKHHPETVSYYNNHPANSFCFNQSKGWEMIQVRPMKHQVLYEVAAIGTGVVLSAILEALSK